MTAAAGQAVLETRALVKRFGGITATDSVSLQLQTPSDRLD